MTKFREIRVVSQGEGENDTIHLNGTPKELLIMTMFLIKNLSEELEIDFDVIIEFITDLYNAHIHLKEDENIIIN